MHAQQVQSTRDLNLGTHLAGSTVEILYDDGNAAAFEITGGTPSAQVEISFVLPSSLSSGGDQVTVTYSTTAAAYNTTNTPSGATTFDPASTVTATLNGSGGLFIWLGASVTIQDPQTAGDYNNDITVDVTFL
jgi:hypothetical protein